MKRISENNYFWRYGLIASNGYIMIFFRAGAYLRYVIEALSGSGHGVHSPFAFDLVSRVFRNKIDPGVVCCIEKIRRDLLSDNTSIKVKDLGAGSGIMGSDSRKISDLARYSAVPQKYGQLLYRLSSEFGAPSVVEFGTSLGISTMYLASAVTGIPVFTMEGCPETAAIAERNFKKAGLDNITVLKGSFDDSMTQLQERAGTPGLVFIDGDHRREAVLRYFSRMAEIAGADTVIVLDDIYHSEEMGKAWEEIRKHPGVTLSVDVYRMGLVFFREGVTSITYRIRY